jgi:RNA polymerase sigma factor (sigma-70 family)
MVLDSHTQEVLAQIGWLRRVASREAADLHAAEDDLQEALVRALRSRPRASRAEELRSWLRSIVRSVAHDRRRREARLRNHEHLAAERESERVHDSDDRETAVALVRQALRRVREPYRSAVWLRYLEGLSAADVALRLRISPEAVRQRTSRGLRLMRTELEQPRGFEEERSWWTRLGGLALIRGFRARLRPGEHGAIAALAAGALGLVITVASVCFARPAGPEGPSQTARIAQNVERVVRPVQVRPVPGAERPARLDEATQRPLELARPANLEVELAVRPGDRYGRSLARLGDLDGDGTLEFAIGADAGGESSTGEGSVWIASLEADGHVRRRHKIGAPRVPERPLATGQRALFGYRLCSPGDLDGDGVPELCVGAPGYDAGGRASVDGRVWMFFLDRRGEVLRSHEISAFSEPACARVYTGDGFGSDLAPLGDLDGDGLADLAVGAHNSAAGGLQRGTVWVLFLRADGSVRAAREINATAGGFEGRPGDGDHFGHGLACLGDLNRDGTPDLAVGAWLTSDVAPDLGAVWIVFLRRDGSVLAQHEIAPRDLSYGSQVVRRFGTYLTAIGDQDGDGLVELVVVAEGSSRVLALDSAGRVRASTREAMHDSSLAVLGLSADGRTLRVLRGIPRRDEERGAVELFEVSFAFRPEGLVR